MSATILISHWQFGHSNGSASQAFLILAHAGAVEDRVAGLVDLHLFDGERVADDVLGKALQVFAFVGQSGARRRVTSRQTIPLKKSSGGAISQCMFGDITEKVQKLQ